jgi:hypothetical protein
MPPRVRPLHRDQRCLYIVGDASSSEAKRVAPSDLTTELGRRRCDELYQWGLHWGTNIWSWYGYGLEQTSQRTIGVRLSAPNSASASTNAIASSRICNDIEDGAWVEADAAAIHGARASYPNGQRSGAQHRPAEAYDKGYTNLRI